MKTKNFLLIIVVLILTCNLGFSQEEDSEAIKKMHATTDLTVEWLKRNIKISDEQAKDFVKILNVPKEKLEELGNLGKEHPDSLEVMQAKVSVKIKQDFKNTFTPGQWEEYNLKKEEFGKWLEKKLKALGY